MNMYSYSAKVSKISPEELTEFCRIDDPDEQDAGHIVRAMSIVRAFIRSYTGLTDDEIDEHEDITWAYMVLVRDNYDNRSLQENAAVKINRTVSIILDQYNNHLLR